MKRWTELAQFFGHNPQAGAPGLVVQGLSLSSHGIQDGGCFVAISGAQSHGAQYWLQAKQRGAVCVLSDQPIEDCDLPLLIVDNLSARLPELAGWFYDYPSKKIKLIGITGTNGKTSTTQYIAQLLGSMGVGCGVLGTLGNGCIGQLQPTQNTTLEPLALNAWLNTFVQQGLKFAVLEVSSHAIALGRINGLEFACVGLTQVTRDHLDFHGDVTHYQATKKRLFEAFPADHKVVNLDDAIGQEIARQSMGSVFGYSQKDQQAQVYVNQVQFTEQGILGVLYHQKIGIEFCSRLIGQFSVENSCCAVSCLVSLGFDWHQIVQAVSNLQPIAGRMQKVECQKNAVTALVDYAHTPDALEQVLLSVAAHRPTGQLWLVFGCGGNRDVGKRPLMAEVAERLADKIILTNDNPRFEDPEQIIADICQGFSQPILAQLEVILCRKAAIETALNNAQEGDWVLVVGKGHETYQEIQGVKTPFSDQQVLEQWQIN